MSQFPSAPTPGAYVPPTSPEPSSTPYNQQPQGQHYQPTSSSQSHGSYHGTSSSSSFGNILNQAVTTGKPVWDKFNKSLSSKLNKPPKSSAPTTPSHLESYQQYQGHQQQQQQSAQQYNNQTPPQWTPHTTNTYTPQQSPYPPSSYANLPPPPPQNNYFPQQSNHSSSPSQQQPPQFPPSKQQSYNQHGVHGQGDGAGDGHIVHQQPSPQPYLNHGLAQQSGAQPYTPTQTPASPPLPHVPDNSFGGMAYSQNQPQLQPYQQWPSQQAENPASAHANHNSAPQGLQQSNTYASPPSPPQLSLAAPPVPQHPNFRQEWNAAVPPISPIQQTAGYNDYAPHPPSMHPNNVTISPGPIAQPPQGNAAQGHAESTSPHPPQATITSNEFIAELPADLGGLSLGGSQPLHSANISQSPSQQYNAYRSPIQSQSPNSEQTASFKVPRKSISSLNAYVPLNDPWQTADLSTEQPTREFHIIADLLYDALDRKCEPRNTGYLEASKILETWKVQGEPIDIISRFAQNSYQPFASLWTLESIAHSLVPSNPLLVPSSSARSDPQIFHMSPTLPLTSSSIYIPTLNKAGWYKYLFMELLGKPEVLERLISAFCADVYNPATSQHPDLTRRDESESQSSLTIRAVGIRKQALARVCDELGIPVASG